METFEDTPESKRRYMRNRYFSTQKWKLNKCLAPGECVGQAIRAHSLQNKGVLEFLVDKGHVIGICPLIGQEGPTTHLGKIGRNDASTFEGFCANHDTKLFAPLETKPFDLTDTQQLFLLGYRASAHTTLATMRSAAVAQTTYQDRVSIGWDKGNQPEKAGWIALGFMGDAYGMWNYHQALNESLTLHDFGKLRHLSITVDCLQPTVAVSSCFNFRLTPEQEEDSRICLNVFPIDSTRTCAVMSFTEEDEVAVKNKLSRLIDAQDGYQEYLLSKLILANCQNFVLAPTVFATWSHDKTHRIMRFFANTVKRDVDAEDAALNIFR